MKISWVVALLLWVLMLAGRFCLNSLFRICVFPFTDEYTNTAPIDSLASLVSSTHLYLFFKNTILKRENTKKVVNGSLIEIQKQQLLFPSELWVIKDNKWPQEKNDGRHCKRIAQWIEYSISSWMVLFDYWEMWVLHLGSFNDDKWTRRKDLFRLLLDIRP